MKIKHKLISILLAIAMLASMVSTLGVSAAPPTSLEIGTIADISDDVAAAFAAAIKAGSQDVDGVYFDVTFPALNLGTYELTYSDYLVMAANAIYELSEESPATTQIPHRSIQEGSQSVLNGTGTSLNKAQYVELAERVAKYGNTMGSLPTSFNRPKDGTTVYEGRMTVYSIAHLFAEVLASYHTTKVLPETMTFLPVHYGDVDVVAVPTAPDDWYKAVMDAAIFVKEKMASNILPGSIPVGPLTVTPAQFLYLAMAVTVGIDQGQTSGELTIPEAAEPGNPQGTGVGQCYREDYVDMARRTVTWIETNKQAPNYSTSSDLGPVHYYDLVSGFARILAWYVDTGDLPNYNTFHGWSGTVEDVQEPTTAPSTAPTTAPTTPTTAPTESEPVPTSSTQPMTDDWYTNVVIAATNICNYVATNEDLPETITVGTTSLRPAQYLYLAGQVIHGLNKGQTTGSLSVPSYAEPENPTETLNAGTLSKADYLDMATRTNNFMVNNGQAANYCSTSLGQMHHHGVVYLMASVLDYYAKNGVLPDSIAVKPWYEYLGVGSGDASFGNDFSAYKQYMVPTTNCPSNNATIISVAKAGMAYSTGAHGGYKKPATTYQAMFNLMEYMVAKISYDSYYDTQRGALGTWNAKAGNCCDMAHLMNACARSLGVPGRYAHWNCQFAVTNTGHVWSDVYCPDAPGTNSYNKPGWLPADPVNTPNYLGYQNHTNEYKRGGPYATLPF